MSVSRLRIKGYWKWTGSFKLERVRAGRPVRQCSSFRSDNDSPDSDPEPEFATGWNQRSESKSGSKPSSKLFRDHLRHRQSIDVSIFGRSTRKWFGIDHFNHPTCLAGIEGECVWIWILWSSRAKLAVANMWFSCRFLNLPSSKWSNRRLSMVGFVRHHACFDSEIKLLQSL